MSSVYVVEPPTKGKVVFNTNMGPLDIELWPKEAPKATRNFVQLCLEGYYDRTIFHRIIKSFLVQGGDPTGTGTGGESIYGGSFADEFHSRLRFNHRGLVACANAGSPHSNGSQFFITLDRCDWIDKKNTIFGKVTGDSVFNLLRIGTVETDKDDKPLDPQPKILSVEVLWNPFDDIVPRQVLKKSLSTQKNEDENQDQKKKAVKKLNLLSFGEEAEEEEKVLSTVKDKIKSIHDELNDPRFIKEEMERKSSPNGEKKKDTHITVRAALSKKGEFDRKTEEDGSESLDSDDHADDDGASFDARMRKKILKKRQERGEITTREKPSNDKHTLKDASLSSREHWRRRNALERLPDIVTGVAELVGEVAGEEVAAAYLRMEAGMNKKDVKDDGNRGAKIEKLSVKKKGIGSEARAERMAKADVDLQLLGPAEQERHMYKQKRRRLQGHEDDTLAKLDRFRRSFLEKNNAASKGSEAEDLSAWKENELKFTPEPSNKSGMSRNEDPNDYVVHDPLLEKGKEKFNKMQAKLKRREREWAGKSIT